MRSRDSETLRRELERQGITDQRVLRAMETIPRDHFVRRDLRPRAWENSSLPLGHGQTISQPIVVAVMTELLELGGDERVLEIGTGSGYQTAILARLARAVWSCERIEALLADARRRLAALAITNVELRLADGSVGLPREAPFDAIVVTAAAPRMPESLLEQLADGGRLVVPIGPRDAQTLQRIRRRGTSLEITDSDAVRFVPLIGKEGWEE